MYKENVTAAIKLLTNNMQNVIFPINKDTLDSLKQKQPQGKVAYESIILTDTPQEMYPANFGIISAENTRKATMKANG